MMGVLALAGVAIPYLMGRKDKELMNQLLSDAKQTVTDTQQQLAEVKAAAVEAKQHRDTTQANAEESGRLLRHSTSGQEKTPEKKIELALAAKSVKEDIQASQIDKLRAEAVQAATQEDAEKAHTLWAAVAALEPTDHVAQFNTGYWAQMQANKETPQGTRFWLQEAARAYAQALQIKPDMHDAASNWGNALAAEAKVLADSDLPAARALWLQAGQRYAQALQIKPDMHEAASNWGNALDAEAKVLADSDLPAARALWLQAGQRYVQALQIKPDLHEAASNLGGALLHEWQAVVATDPGEANKLLERALTLLQSHAQSAPNVVAYNLACCFGLKGDVRETLKWLECAADAGELLTKSKIRADKDFDGIRNDSRFVTWLDKLKEE